MERPTATLPPKTPRPSPPLRAARALLLLGASFLPLTAVGPASAEPAAEPVYSLDSIPRQIASHGPVPCPKVDLVTYSGDIVRFQPATRIFSGFKDRLMKFERVVQEVGIEVYGRAPSRIVNLGTHNCRRMTTYRGWLSEHSLGNAIDVEGFNFAGLPKDGALPAGVPKAFKGPFEVRLAKHWNAKTGYAALHARFLKTLAQRLIGRKDVFRVLLGPGYPGHHNHFHFDMSNFRLVEIYDGDELLTADPKPRTP